MRRHVAIAFALLVAFSVGWTVRTPARHDGRGAGRPDPVSEALRHELSRVKSVRVEYEDRERPGERVHRTFNVYRVQPYENHLPPRRPSERFDWNLTLHAGEDGGGELLVSYLLAPHGEPFILK
jgi:hypothetical protein